MSVGIEKFQNLIKIHRVSRTSNCHRLENHKLLYSLGFFISSIKSFLVLGIRKLFWSAFLSLFFLFSFAFTFLPLVKSEISLILNLAFVESSGFTNLYFTRQLSSWYLFFTVPANISCLLANFLFYLILTKTFSSGLYALYIFLRTCFSTIKVAIHSSAFFAEFLQSSAYFASWKYSFSECNLVLTISMSKSSLLFPAFNNSLDFFS